MTMPGLAGGGRPQQFASQTPLDRLIRKEVALGVIRERPFPEGHIGLTQIAPFLSVGSDDVIFDYIKGGLQEGLAPARAEDAESELSQKDMLLAGSGRASVIDWALKDEYSASDVTRYRDDLILRQALQGANVQLAGGWPDLGANLAAKVVRDDARRRRMLDNRMEWLIMQAVENGTIVYNDGKIKFTVDFGRPVGQHNQAPAGGLYNSTTHDPIGDLITVNEFMYVNYGFRFSRAITSRRVLQTFWKTAKFTALAGVVGGTPSAPIDPNYLLPGWGPQYAIDAVEQATGIRFEIYDSVYRTRAVGASTWTNNRFLSDNKIFFLPTDADLGASGVQTPGGTGGIIDETQIGFAKTLTAPHPEGNWQPGYYEWEMDTKDPWQTVRGTGLKAFPIFPFMDHTYTMTVL
jgi:hypothetical protein